MWPDSAPRLPGRGGPPERAVPILSRAATALKAQARRLGAAAGSCARSFLFALSFLTRIPVPVAQLPQSEVALSVVYFPIVGGMLGGALWAIALASAGCLPATVVAVLLVATSALATGALHLDGVADLSDAAGGGQGNRSRMFTIMEDSRIGAHGAVGLILVLLAKWCATTAALEAATYAPIAAAPAIARGWVALAIVWLPAAKPKGLARALKTGGGSARALLSGSLLVAGLWALAPEMAPAALAALATSGALAAWAQKRLGGMTGDVHGALIEVAETTVLLAASAAHAT